MDTPQEVPEAGLGDDLVGREDAHTVNLGGRIMLGGEMAADDLEFLETHSRGKGGGRNWRKGSDFGSKSQGDASSVSDVASVHPARIPAEKLPDKRIPSTDTRSAILAFEGLTFVDFAGLGGVRWSGQVLLIIIGA